MDILILLIPLALLLATGAIGAFAWAVRHGEFDDLDSPALRVLLEEQPVDRDADFSNEVR